MLRFDPPDEIIFKGSTSIVSIISEHEFRRGRIVFQVQSNPSGDYRINPTYGFIQPCDSVEIEIKATFDNFDDHDADQFTIQYFLVEDDQCDASAENYWKKNAKHYRKHIHPKILDCHFENIPITTQFPVQEDNSERESPTLNDSLVASSHHMKEFGAAACTMHKKVINIKMNLDELVHEINEKESQELKQIKESVQKTAYKYRQLEEKTLLLVERTSTTAADVKEAANHAARKKISIRSAFKSIEIDFKALEKQIQDVRDDHIGLIEDLNQQADQAKIAKETNDRREAKAEGLKESARASALMSIPGAALLALPVAGAMALAEDSDSDNDEVTALKVCKGIGGFFLGLGAGIGVTAISPALLAYSATCGVRLAVLSRKWSSKFQDMEGKIRDVAAFIDELAKSLRGIQNGLQSLETNVSKSIAMPDDQDISWIFEIIAQKSEQLQEVCQQYQMGVQANKKRIDKVMRKKDKS